MMKFLSLALAMLTVVEAKRTLSGQIVNKPALLSKAVPVDANMQRRVAEQQNVQLTGEYSIKFNHCVSLQTQPDNKDVMFGENVVAYTKAGKIVAQKSYVLFELCESSSCGYAGEENLYLVDLETYMGLVEYKPTMDQNYCDACRNAQDWCQNGQYQQQANNAEAEQEEEREEEKDEREDEKDDKEEENREGENDREGDRRLNNNNNNKNNNRKKVVVNCDTCSYMNCFAQGNDDKQEDGMEQWLENLKECEDTGVVWNNQELYAGFMCNNDGSGVEIAIFLDEECSIYNSMQAYKNVASSSENYAYFQKSQNFVTYPFTHAISCAQEPEYITPEEYQNNGEGNEGNGEGDEGNGENYNEAVNDFCKEIYDEEAMPLNDCNGDGQQDYKNPYNQIEKYTDDAYGIYSYVLTQENSEDMAAVCVLVSEMQGEYSYIYNADEASGSGSFYTYHATKTHRGHAFMIFFLIVVALAAAAVFVQVAMKQPKSKREPLITSNEGHMA